MHKKCQNKLVIKYDNWFLPDFSMIYKKLKKKINVMTHKAKNVNVTVN